jgi:hypothetical protein
MRLAIAKATDQVVENSVNLFVKFFFSVSVVCAFVLITPVTYACSCATGDPPSEFNRAKAVFIGRMLGGTEKLSVKDKSGKAYSIEAGTVRFEVEESFKGDVSGRIHIEIASMKGTSCGPYGLSKGARYLVYAYVGEPDTNTLYSGVCTRTQVVAGREVKEDLNFLRNLPPPGTGGNLRGRVWADLRAGGATPLPNLKISISGPDSQALTAITDEHGHFEIKFLKPGKYTVRPKFPENYYSDHDTEDVTINDRGTADVGFEAYINGSVRGRLVDADGNGFNSGFLHLVAGKKSVYGHSIGEHGIFEVEGVPPDEYLLYIEMESRDYKKNQYFYYPGTFKREEATPITVGLGEKMQDLQFVLPDKFRVRTIEGQVTWKDGKPAANVEVMLLCPQSREPDGFSIEFSPTRATTDDSGNFKLEGFTGETYWIEARASSESALANGFHSPSQKIAVSENIKNISLTLSEKGYFGGCPD